MQKPFLVTEQKLAERLFILRERGTGMLTRIYNIKKGTDYQYLRWGGGGCAMSVNQAEKVLKDVESSSFT